MDEISLSIEETNKLRAKIGLAPIPVELEVKNDEVKHTTDRSTTQTELSVEETNKLRASIGLKPIPVNEKPDIPEVPEAPAQAVEELENVESEKIKHRIELVKDRALKRRAHNAIEGEEKSKEDWLASLGAPKPKKTKRLVQSSSHDLSGVKIGHSAEQLQDVDGAIFTLKDTDVMDETDELNNAELVRKAKVKHDIKEKQASDQLKFSGRRQSIEEDEDASEVVIRGQGVDIQVQEKPKEARPGKVAFGLFDEEDEEQEQVKSKPVKMKKLKKSKSKARSIDVPEEMRVVELEQFDDKESDDELRAMIAAKRSQKQKRRQGMTPKQVAEEIALHQRLSVQSDIEKGEVYNGFNDFLRELSAGIKGNANNEEDKEKENGQEYETNLTSQENEQRNEPENEKDQEEKDQEEKDQEENGSANFRGVASTLKYLQSNNTVSVSSSTRRAQREAAREAELLKIKIGIEQRLLREEYEADPEFMQLPKTERAEILAVALDQRLVDKNIISAKPKVLEEYDPQVRLSYRDETGVELDTKGAFKYLSHQFHGVGPGNAKVEKKLKKMKSQAESTERIV